MAGPSLQRIVWLASFPKSGNTWTRIFLANLMMPANEVPDINHLYRFTTADVRQDFFDRAAGGEFRGSSTEDWLKVRPKVLALIAASKPGHHFVKTHSQIGRMEGTPLIPPGVTAGAVYLMRNPFDVALSYARHLSMDLDATIDRMLDPTSVNATSTGILEFIGRWDAHVASWAEAPGLAPHVMRYEDMIADPETTFRSLIGYLRVQANDGKLRKAIRAASFKNLQAQESKKGFRERPEGMQRFFATGQSGGWREKMTPAQISRLVTEFEGALSRHYPEILDEARAAARGAA
ncbi:MAG: sulfotransferase domain-containing protein [Pseudomonadota bacterium]